MITGKVDGTMVELKAKGTAKEIAEEALEIISSLYEYIYINDSCLKINAKLFRTMVLSNIESILNEVEERHDLQRT